jgi:hypothetical protein
LLSEVTSYADSTGHDAIGSGNRATPQRREIAREKRKPCRREGDDANWNGLRCGIRAG